jgi:hypothetical protein
LLSNNNFKGAIKEFELANEYPANLEVAPHSNGGYGAKVIICKVWLMRL